MGELMVVHAQSQFESHTKTRRKPNYNRKKSNQQENLNNGSSRATAAGEFPGKSLVMGQVKILKRGESLAVFKDREPKMDQKKSKKKVGFAHEPELHPTVRLGPEPEMVPKQTRMIGDGAFAGSAVLIDSPPASSLPLPLALLRTGV